MWRPLHEIDGGWFWWTCTSKPQLTAKLWKVVFDHLVNERGFHNLIWVYSAGVGNPQGSGDKKKDVAYRKRFYPGAEYVDISGIDIYGVDYADTGIKEFWNCTQSYREAFEMIEEVTPGKMLALTECQAVPNMDKTWNDDQNFAPWLWALPWYADNKKNPCNWIQQTYTHANMIAIEDAPDFKETVAIAPWTIQDGYEVPVRGVENGIRTDLGNPVRMWSILGRKVSLEKRPINGVYLFYAGPFDRVLKQIVFGEMD